MVITEYAWFMISALNDISEKSLEGSSDATPELHQWEAVGGCPHPGLQVQHIPENLR